MSQDKEYSWVPLDLTGLRQLPVMPQGAVVAGHENGRPTYVARVRKDNHWELGKLNSWARFGFGWFGKEYEDPCGEVLVANSQHEPVWINGAYGEHVDGIVSSTADYGVQSVGRAWHRDRWIPGKVVHFCNCLFFSFGGQELAVRKYQLLSSDFVWAPSSQAPSGVVRVADSNQEADSSNSLVAAVRYPSGDGASDMVLVARTSEREAEWSVSGDGEYMRHSIAFPNGHQIGKAWIERDGQAYWALGKVLPPTLSQGQPGLSAEGQLHPSYQVLTVGPKREAPRLLSLTIRSNVVQSLLDSDVIPSKDIFMLTKLSSNEHPWTAVRQMVEETATTDNARLAADVQDHLQPMMPMIEQLAIAEVQGRSTTDLPEDISTADLLEGRSLANLPEASESEQDPLADFFSGLGTPVNAEFPDERICYPLIDADW